MPRMKKMRMKTMKVKIRLLALSFALDERRMKKEEETFGVLLFILCISFIRRQTLCPMEFDTRKPGL